MAVQETSLHAYDDLRPELPRREALVLKALEQFHGRHRQWPTAYELFKAMQSDGVAKDLNDCRPRLTALKEKGQVENPAEKRRCGVTRKRAFLWRLTDAPRLF